MASYLANLKSGLDKGCQFVFCYPDSFYQEKATVFYTFVQMPKHGGTI